MKNIPRIRLAHLPTPLEPLQRLSAFLGGPAIWVKRDDQTGLALGGNKVRKLEFLLAEALANGAKTLITAGAAQSNHCRQTAAAAARRGLDCILVLSGEPPGRYSGNLLLDQLFGAQVVWTSRQQRQQILQDTFDQAWEQGKRPYLIPYGGSNPTGAAGYAFALEELLAQRQLPETAMPLPDWVVFASSSGGTQAGLAAGAELLGYDGKILGISIDEPKGVLQERVADLANQTIELLGGKAALSGKDILVNDGYLGGGYGVMGEAEQEAVKLFAYHEGLLLDPVYTGRAAGGLIDLVRKDFFKQGQTVLFWHTGGTPALFADRYQDIVKE